MVGLPLLLSPLSPNVIVQAACCSVGIAHPVYSTFKAVENKNESEQQRWLLYWAGSRSTIMQSLHFLFGCNSHLGARHLYARHLRPFLLRHQARLDQIMGFVSSQMAKFMSARYDELQVLKAIFCRFAMAANQVVKGVVHPGQAQERNQIEGPTSPPSSQIDDSDSDLKE